MFVQISPNAADLGETLCSLNFASRVRGIEHGPTRKQAYPTELFKLKQLPDNTSVKVFKRSILLFVKMDQQVRDLENQLTEERKIRQKQETRALAVVSAQSPALSALNQAHKSLAEKKPPLVPSKLRLPLHGITNFLPPPSPLPPYRTRTSSILPVSTDNKENLSKMIMSVDNQAKQKSLKSKTGFLCCQTTTSTNKSAPMPRLRTSHVTGRQSFVWDLQTVWRASQVQSPMPRLREGVAATVMATPIAPRSGKFVGSPPTHWRLKHLIVVPLQKKHLVWSPLKLRGVRNGNRKSFLPSDAQIKL
ncbi:P-loop containing nucleoside triphosphate hydrolases superfamily protein [Actinidia rufa]|uniref:P-loop containing nucleoside triphosphate hydrolases superfamily protein n=1 Tax=Actinidia rufa TaxID=165716 RepID=A0A7J0F851_9ERIC|nr:P-loop containing nucleoside triphosphate hydrolases superfamily protein [Actinidia rufa]